MCRAELFQAELSPLYDLHIEILMSAGFFVYRKKFKGHNKHRKAQDAKRKRKNDRTEEEKEALAKEREMKKKQQALFDLLRNVSIRLPLLIYGSATEFDDSIHLEDFIQIVDEASWKEFMPKGVDKAFFRKLLVFYDEDVIEGAGMRIRRMAKAADELMPTQRIMRIAEIFNCFRNPAKETVLTPWRVVNMHMGDMIGGYNFYAEGYLEKDGVLEHPRLIEQGEVTTDIFLDENVKVLEMNSKSGLYPLYVAYSIYRMLLPKDEQELSLEEAQEYWRRALEDHLFVLCQTTMAVAITKRTLSGYTGNPVNAIYLTKLLERMENQRRLANKLRNPATWGKEGDNKMKFNAVVGNPPYQQSDGGSKASAVPIYQRFVYQAKTIEPDYISMITPAKWFSGGRGLDSFRNEMMNDRRIAKLIEYANSLDLFSNVDIAGGLCYFLWDKKHNGKCELTNVTAEGRITKDRFLNEYSVIIKNNKAIPILEKVRAFEEKTLESIVSSQKPFGLRTYEKPDDEGELFLRWSGGIGPIKRERVTAGLGMIEKWKVMISYLTAEHAGQPDKNGHYRVLSTNEILAPQFICTETYLIAGAFDTEAEAKNYLAYLRTRLVRFLILLVATTQHISQSSFSFVPMQDFTREWKESDLYEKYGLSEDEIATIENLIKPMD